MVLVALVAPGMMTPAAYATPDVLYVAHDCSIITATHCYTLIQAAVNAAVPGDAIRVAEGTYYESVTLTKSVTLEGGWGADFGARDWTCYTTTIDARRAGPAIRIEGTVSPTIEGFVITGGDGTPGARGGGGVQIYRPAFQPGSAVLIRHNIITGNLACRASTCAGDGGGVAVYNSAAILEHNAIIGNIAQLTTTNGGRGGGVYVGASALATLTGNLIARNTAVYSVPWMTDGRGGGVYADEGRLVLQDNLVEENSAFFGGGVFLHTSSGAVTGNRIISNTAVRRGGGLYVYRNVTAILDSNHVLSNTVAAGEGGGVCIRGSDLPLTMTNHIIARNSAVRDGGGVYVCNSPAVNLVNNTIVDNNGGSGQEGVALLKVNPEPPSWVTMTNNILLGHSVGVTVAVGCVAWLSHNDYYSNTIDVSGQPSGTLSLDMSVDPQFIDRLAGDYHLSLASLLIDAGDNGATITHDFEGDPRPHGAGIDVGADEMIERHIYLPAVMRGR